MNASSPPQVPVIKPSRKSLVLVLLAVTAGAILICALVVGFVFSVMAIVNWAGTLANKTPEHRCTMALLQQNAQARSLLGTPFAQRGWTTASFNTQNRDYHMEMSFSVAGPRQGGTASARGHRSPFESSFQVVLETDDGHRVPLYDGPFTCPVKI